MKKWCMSILMIFILAGCQATPFGQQVVIDWVDFIKWDGKEYNGIHEGVLANPEVLGEKLGEVKFKVADNVSDPEYKTKDGDAAFHEKGTEIFEIQGHPNLIAVPSKDSINGYRVYHSREDMDYQWHFRDMPVDKVERIEIYENVSPDGHRLLTNFSEKETIVSLLELLKNSKEDTSFQPNTTKGDPTMYEMVFYTDGPVAYKFGLLFDGATYFWYPWDTAILSDEIGHFLPGK